MKTRKVTFWGVAKPFPIARSSILDRSEVDFRTVLSTREISHSLDLLQSFAGYSLRSALQRKRPYRNARPNVCSLVLCRRPLLGFGTLFSNQASITRLRKHAVRLALTSAAGLSIKRAQPLRDAYGISYQRHHCINPWAGYRVPLRASHPSDGAHVDQ